MRSAPLTVLLAPMLLAACAVGGPSVAGPAASPQASPAASPSPQESTSPAPAYPSYYIESLRTRPPQDGRITIGELMFRGAGYTKSHMTWTSGGQVMTGTASIPDGTGPFPVVIVNHGHIPEERYWIGQDSGIFGDPMAAHGFISLAPNYPGYAGSGEGDPAMPTIVRTAVTVMDLVSSLPSLPQADPARVAMMGHSNGGGVSQLVMVADSRVKAAVLFAPVSSDMADNARKWWLTSGSAAPLPTPEADPDGYAHISPRNYFGFNRAPTLLLQGTADQDIPAAWTTATFDALRAQGIKSRLDWFPGGRHDLVGGDLSRAVASAEAWVRETLG
ncbi:MAG: hypothetical protein QOE92_410 [Chloroflexota bacterium]|nr:hypothetical protein [Chloroflexota bacterium]